MRNFALAAAVLGGLSAATPASALPMADPRGADAGAARAVPAALYCNKHGSCIKVKRPGYVLRGPVVRGCGSGWRWNGHRCARNPGVVIKGPDVKVEIR